MTLDLEPTRIGPEPKGAATVMVVRERPGVGLEVFCVERNKGTRFLGGALVFPGGKLDPSDGDARWDALARHYEAPNRAGGEAFARETAICALRECFEEACILHVHGIATDVLGAWHAAAAQAGPAGDTELLAARLAAAGAHVDLGAFVPIARWVTPVQEARRFDTRFFVTRAPEGQEGRVDGGEATRGVWATAAHFLAEFAAGRVALFPPTHRMLEVLAACATWRDVEAYASGASLAPICPEVARVDDTVALTMPGDREHSEREPLIAGRSRYVLRGEQWLPE